MAIKTIFIKIQEAFKSLGLASQLGITLGISLAMLAGVYALSQDLSPLPKVTQVVEIQTTDATSSHSPGHSEKSEKTITQKELEVSTTVSTTELPVTTEEKKVVFEKQKQETKVAVTPSKESLTTEKVMPQTSETEMNTSTEQPTVKIDGGESTSETTTTVEVTTSAHRLVPPLGNTNTEFKHYKDAVQYMREKLDESSKSFEQGKQDWVYSGRVYSISWSDGRTTFTVDLIPKVMTPQTPDTSGISTELNQ